MNGRVYDPRIGRFLSTDPIMQTIALSQALNPYSYVMNNPLTLIDPSGYSWLSKAFSAIGKFFKRLFKSIARSLNIIVGFVVFAIGAVMVNPLIMKAGIAISAFPVQVTYRSGRFGVSVGYGFVNSGEVWSSGGATAAPPPTWGGGYGTVAGMPVLGLDSSASGADPSQGGQSWFDEYPLEYLPGFLAETAVGFGDGVYRAVTLGQGSLEDVRRLVGTSSNSQDSGAITESGG